MRSARPPAAASIRGSGGLSTWAPLKWLISASSYNGASTAAAPAKAASSLQAAGRSQPQADPVLPTIDVIRPSARLSATMRRT